MSAKAEVDTSVRYKIKKIVGFALIVNTIDYGKIQRANDLR